MVKLITNIPTVFVASLALPLSMANYQSGTISFHSNLYSQLYELGIFDSNCNILEPKPHSCWESGKLHCDYHFNCINENCIRIDPKSSQRLDCSIQGDAAYDIIPVKKGQEKVNFYASASENGCNETKYENSVKCVEIKGFRVSCKSDYFQTGKSYAGVIVYDAGTFNDGKRHGRVYPGYTTFFDTSNGKMDEYKKWTRTTRGESNEGVVHGYSVWRRFGENPSTLSEKYGMKFSGFSYHNGKLKFNSGALNASPSWERRQRTMVKDEEVIVKALFMAWKTNGIASTYWADENKRSSLIPWVCEALIKMSEEKEARAYSNTIYPKCKNEVDAFFD